MSLFGSDSEEEVEVASILKSIKPIGLYHFKNLIPLELQLSLTNYLSLNTFSSNYNQSMLFGSNLPKFLIPLLTLLPPLLKDLIPIEIYQLLFSTTTTTTNHRQVIFNLYKPGEGITSHIDLPTRYSDGIIGISLISSTTMIFTKQSNEYSIRLNPGDLYILSGESRNDWLHGIESKDKDWVKDQEGDEEGEGEGEGRWIKRRLRMSITLRRMKPGGDILGNTISNNSSTSDVNNNSIR